MKKLVLVIITILIMTLSTGCGSSEQLSPEETLPDVWQPTVMATLPESNLPKITLPIEESSSIIETEAETTTTEEETTTEEPAPTTTEAPTVPETIAAAVVPQKTYPTSGFVYYSVAGACPNRDYEEYLYNQLNSLGIAWWYPYAVAQIFQESRWNPNSTNGEDHGICQFKGIYFEKRAKHYAGMTNANIWNPYDSLKVYAYYIKAVLAACNNKVDATLSFYIVGGTYYWHQDYINRVMSWYKQLKA